jgi:hypothetical protein
VLSPSGVDQAEWEFVCLLPLFDPPRHDTKETIERCREKGIDVKMVTGDQLLIGKETSRQLGMGTDMYSTEALLEVRLSFASIDCLSYSFPSLPSSPFRPCPSFAILPLPSCCCILGRQHAQQRCRPSARQ